MLLLFQIQILIKLNLVIYNCDEPKDIDLVVWTAGIQPVEVVRNLPIDINSNGRVIVNQYHQVPTYRNVYVVGDCADLPHAPSAQLAEVQGDQIADVLKKQWLNEPLPDKMPELKVQGIVGSLGSTTRFCIYHGPHCNRTTRFYFKIRRTLVI